MYQITSDPKQKVHDCVLSEYKRVFKLKCQETISQLRRSHQLMPTLLTLSKVSRQYL